MKTTSPGSPQPQRASGRAVPGSSAGLPRVALAALPPESPDREPEPSDRPLTEEEKEQILREARDRIDRQRRLLRENYRQMHAALLRAFPLREALQGEE